MIPPNPQFWSYYARGTYQNQSVFKPHYSYAQPGCFLYKLTRSPFDTLSVPDGIYDSMLESRPHREPRDPVPSACRARTAARAW